MFVMAYIDAATGALLLQAVIGSGLMVMVMLKFYWNKVKRIFSRNVSSEEEGGGGTAD